jgi:hypothetical protein
LSVIRFDWAVRINGVDSAKFKMDSSAGGDTGRVSFDINAPGKVRAHQFILKRLQLTEDLFCIRKRVWLYDSASVAAITPHFENFFDLSIVRFKDCQL